MNQPASILPIAAQEPNYLKENWKRVLGSENSQGMYRVVRVHSGAATITNGKVCIRAPSPLVDGFYLFNQRNELEPQADLRAWRGYPDILTLRPPFELMTPSPRIERETVIKFTQYLEAIRPRKVNVVMDKYGVIPVARRGLSAAGEELPTFGFGFELPLHGEELILDPDQLKLGLIEMMRYDHCYLSRFHMADKETPLVLGHDWTRCALIAPCTRSWEY
jgi:hypothetical protein